MTLLDVVRNFSEESHRATSVRELYNLIESAAKELGFEYFALVHHVDLNAPPEGAIKIDNYPTNWYETLLERRYYVDDPIHVASQRTAVGFKWSDIGRYLDLTTRQQDILRHAKREGLADGFSAPAHIPGEFTGSCSFGVRAGKEVREEALPAAQLLASYAFEAARRLNRRNMKALGRPSQSAERRLTPRQVDCVVLLSRGKSDWEIGKILGISKSTAHKHIEAAKQHFSVATRQQLVVCALYSGELTFADALGRQPG